MKRRNLVFALLLSLLLFSGCDSKPSGVNGYVSINRKGRSQQRGISGKDEHYLAGRGKRTVEKRPVI